MIIHMYIYTYIIYMLYIYICINIMHICMYIYKHIHRQNHKYKQTIYVCTRKYLSSLLLGHIHPELPHVTVIQADLREHEELPKVQNVTCTHNTKTLETHVSRRHSQNKTNSCSTHKHTNTHTYSELQTDTNEQGHICNIMCVHKSRHTKE